MVIRNFKKKALIAGLVFLTAGSLIVGAGLARGGREALALSSPKPWYQTIWVQDGKIVISLDFLHGSLFHISF